jgi:Tfp pilus assembly major pilin PilA
MGMVFCRGCGKELHESAPTCPHCGAVQRIAPVATGDSIPDEIKGWSWGAFLLSWIWAIGNRTWIGLLALIPYVGFIMAIVLGVKGREWAWKNKQWDSVEHFNKVQKRWSFWGVMLVLGIFIVGVLLAISIPAYQGYVKKAHQAQLSSDSSFANNIAPVTPSSRDLVDEVSISNLDTKIDQFGNKTITGLATNNTDKRFSYVLVELNLYDREGTQVGSTMADANNLEPSGKWRFEAPILNNEATSYKLQKVSAF